MAMKSELVEELRIAPGDFERVLHLHEPPDAERGLCGGSTPYTGERWYGEDRGDICVVCAEIARTRYPERLRV